jgi:ethanolamine ammonia-lyase small subunit
VVGDGLSAAAVVRQVPVLLRLLEEGACRRGWSFGRPFLVRYCRVGVLNDVGELLDPVVVVLLIASGRGWRRRRACQRTWPTGRGPATPTPSAT